MNLAIKGHYTRGEEVIKILEMLGGRNVDNLVGNAIYYYYTIMDDKKIIGAAFYLKALDDKFYILSLEEFLEKFPYKVGDKVQRKGATSCDNVYEIEQINWEYDQVVYIICDLYWKNIKCTVTTENLQPYKEETMEEKIQAYEVTEEICANEIAIEFDPSKFEMIERNGKYFVVKKEPQYPKTYKECCEVLRIPKNEHYIDIDAPLVSSDYNRLVSAFTKLLICRDAYWRIAGEQMGLDKPWKPDDSKNHVYYIFYCVSNDEIRLAAGNLYFNEVFAFPTKEMRDAFYENFKDLITECKELL